MLPVLSSYPEVSGQYNSGEIVVLTTPYQIVNVILTCFEILSRAVLGYCSNKSVERIAKSNCTLLTCIFVLLWHKSICPETSERYCMLSSFWTLLVESQQVWWNELVRHSAMEWISASHLITCGAWINENCFAAKQNLAIHCVLGELFVTIDSVHVEVVWLDLNPCWWSGKTRLLYRWLFSCSCTAFSGIIQLSQAARQACMCPSPPLSHCSCR